MTVQWHLLWLISLSAEHMTDLTFERGFGRGGSGYCNAFGRDDSFDHDLLPAGRQYFEINLLDAARCQTTPRYEGDEDSGNGSIAVCTNSNFLCGVR